MKRILLCAAAACSSTAKPPPPPPVAVAASTTCYAGTSTGMGEVARTIARRVVDPAAHTITEDVTHGADATHPAKTYHVVMAVTGDQFTLSEASGAFTGTGQLSGEPWKWTSWSSVSKIASPPIEVHSDDELTETGMSGKKSILAAGKVVGTSVDELRTFDCAQWDAVRATLAVAELDDAACEQACRNYATLKFWAANGEPDAAKEAALKTKVEAGLAGCVSQCRSANNAIATHCMGAATTVDALAACM